MNRIIVTINVALILILTTASASHAQKAPSSLDALPGGRTISGPGVTQLTNTARSIFNNYVAGLDVCATATNLSPAAATLRLTNTNFQQVTVVLSEGNPQTLCLGSIDNVSLQCGPPDACKVVWRIDTLR